MITLLLIKEVASEDFPAKEKSAEFKPRLNSVFCPNTPVKIKRIPIVKIVFFINGWSFTA
jgi:hypothetical protein